MVSVTNKPLMLSDIMLNIVMLNVAMLGVVAPTERHKELDWLSSKYFKRRHDTQHNDV